jgi:hypothetical protein
MREAVEEVIEWLQVIITQALMQAVLSLRKSAELGVTVLVCEACGGDALHGPEEKASSRPGVKWIGREAITATASGVRGVFFSRFDRQKTTCYNRFVLRRMS